VLLFCSGRCEYALQLFEANAAFAQLPQHIFCFGTAAFTPSTIAASSATAAAAVAARAAGGPSPAWPTILT
jgi:uncharacterized protein YraI